MAVARVWTTLKEQKNLVLQDFAQEEKERVKQARLLKKESAYTVELYRDVM